MKTMLRIFTLAVLWLGLSGFSHGGGTAPPCSFSVPSGPTIAANSLAPSCLTNPAERVLVQSSANYVLPNVGNGGQYIFKSIQAHRDVEVSTWTPEGYTFLRLDGTGTAIYFYHIGNTTNGELQIGIVTGLNESSYPSGTYYPLYDNTDLVHTIGTTGTVCSCGYVKPFTNSQYWTFGVSGFDIYVKYNGVEFARFKEYRQMNAGAVAGKANINGPYGYRNAGSNPITITPTTPAALYSKYGSGEIDMRDWGLRNPTPTTGNITSGSNVLTVADASQFKKGDWAIVEIGHEAGAGMRGTVGVGGTWPSLAHAYADKATMDANPATFPTYGWTQNDGKVYVYQSSPAGWTDFQTQIVSGGGSLNNSHSFYYPTLVVPRSLHGQISQIVGNQLTLVNVDGSAANAAASATGANVYLDSVLPFNDLLQSPRQGFYSAIDKATTLIVPAGTYYSGGSLIGSNHQNWKIKGAGKTQTFFKSPKGMRSFGVNCQNCSGIVVSDFDMSGNHGLNGYGLEWFDSVTPVPASTQVTEYNADGTIRYTQQNGGVSDTQFNVGWWPQGGIRLIQSDNSLIQDINAHDMFSYVYDWENSTNGQANRVTYTQADPVQLYVQWLFEWATSTGGGCTDCSITCNYTCSGPEAFGSTGVTWTRFTSVNAVFSLNASGNFTIQDSSITFTANSQSPMFTTASAGMVQIDTNTGVGFAPQGGVVNDLAMTSSGYYNASKDLVAGINSSSCNPISTGSPCLQNITITGGSYTGPNYDATSTATGGPVGINTNTVVKNVQVIGFTARGLVKSGFSNINVGDGSVINSCADSAISAPTKTGNTIPCP